MIFPEDEEFLAHYGKKGMKWGVRSRPKNTSKSGYIRKTSASGTLKNKAVLTKKKVSDLKTKASSDKNKKIVQGVAAGALIGAGLGVSLYAVKNSKSKTSFPDVVNTIDMTKKTVEIPKRKALPPETAKALADMKKRNPEIFSRPPTLTPAEARAMIPELRARAEETSKQVAKELADFRRKYPG